MLLEVQDRSSASLELEASQPQSEAASDTMQPITRLPLTCVQHVDILLVLAFHHKSSYILIMSLRMIELW